MSQTILVNTSPIQYLHQLGVLHVLQRLFGKICVPEEVVEELCIGKQEGIELPDLRRLDYVDIVSVKEGYARQLIRDLGKGETSVLMCALASPGSLVVLDDLLARRVARSMGVKLTGTAGLLITMKRRGFIQALEPYLVQLEHCGFHLSQTHKTLLLRKADEV